MQTIKSGLFRDACVVMKAKVQLRSQPAQYAIRIIDRHIKTDTFLTDSSTLSVWLLLMFFMSSESGSSPLVQFLRAESLSCLLTLIKLLCNALLVCVTSDLIALDFDL